jgi:hypothetical protein
MVPLKRPTTDTTALYPPPIKSALKIPFISSPPRSPAFNTSAHATPSGKRSSFCSITIALRSGTIMVTPMTPPASAMRVVEI